MLYRTALLQPFVLKYHHTKQPHFDFRLGHNNGVMKSWAMKIRPSYCPYQSRELTQVDDHLREYILFEGGFPEGKPGAGTTLVADKGVWEPLPGYSNLEESLRNGCLKFTLHGERLKGIWNLTRCGETTRSVTNAMFYLVKELDSFAMNKAAAESYWEKEPASILTGRTAEEIEREWYEGKKEPKAEPALFDIEEFVVG